MWYVAPKITGLNLRLKSLNQMRTKHLSCNRIRAKKIVRTRALYLILKLLCSLSLLCARCCQQSQYRLGMQPVSTAASSRLSSWQGLEGAWSGWVRLRWTAGSAASGRPSQPVTSDEQPAAESAASCECGGGGEPSESRESLRTSAADSGPVGRSDKAVPPAVDTASGQDMDQWASRRRHKTWARSVGRRIRRRQPHCRHLCGERENIVFFFCKAEC